MTGLTAERWEVILLAITFIVFVAGVLVVRR